MNSSSPIITPNFYPKSVAPGLPEKFGQPGTTRDVFFATFGALVWDMLSSLSQDLLLAKSILRPTIFAYFLARTSSLAVLSISVLLLTRPLFEQCDPMDRASATILAVSISASSFLFLRRVQAVFQRRKVVVHLFSALWGLCAALTCVISITSVSSGTEMEQISADGYCISISVKSFATSAPISWVVFDSLVFFFVSYGLATEQGSDEKRPIWIAMTFGNTLPRVAKAVLQGGQQYYLVALVANIAAAVLLIAPAVPAPYRVIFACTRAVIAVMACRVFRDLKFSHDTASYQISDLAFAGATTGRGLPHSAATRSRSRTTTTPGVTSRGGDAIALGVV